jgi:hypothetical protein
MRELEGRPIGEIAGILSVSASAVETLLFRARRSVREQLEGSLTCAQAEQAISRQLDGLLSRTEKSQLRAHLRQCEPCAHLARSLRAQRRALKSLGVLPIPGALAWSEFGTGAAMSGIAGAGSGAAASGGAWLAGSLAAKLAAATLVGAVVAGAGYEAAVNHPWATTRHTGNPHTSAHAAAARSGASLNAAPATFSPPISVSLNKPPRVGVLGEAAKADGQRLKRARRRQHTAPSSAPVSSSGHSHAATQPQTTAAAHPRPTSRLAQSHGRKTTPALRARPSVHPVKPAHVAKPKPRPHAATPRHSPQSQIGAAKPAHPPRATPNHSPPKSKPHLAGAAPPNASHGNSAETQSDRSK